MCECVETNLPLLGEWVDDIVKQVKAPHTRKPTDESFVKRNSGRLRSIREKINDCPACRRKAMEILLEKIDLGWKAVWCLRTARLQSYPCEWKHSKIAEVLRIKEGTARNYLSKAYRSWELLFEGEENGV